MRKIFLIFIFIIFTVNAAFSAEIPRANLDEAERYFNNAYIYFLRRDYRDAQVYLDEAIRQNTYMVDYYLLSALNLHRMGEFETPEEYIRHYLEVRPMDISAPRIEQSFSEQDSVLRTVLGTAPVPVSWSYAETTVQSEWNTGYTRPFSIKGLGKVEALGDLVCIPDTFGDRIYIRRGRSSLVGGTFSWSGVMNEIEIPSPVIAIPMGDGALTVFCSEGDVYEISDSNASADYIGTLPSITVSDAAFIAENLFAVSDPADRNIAFYYTGRGDWLVRKWAPPLKDGDLLFEPVAVESYAEWLAVADRANDRIYILNSITHEFFEINNIPKPRDLIWSTLGELFILTDEGKIYNFMIDFGTRTYINRHTAALYENMENIWSLFHSPEGDISWIDIGASRIFKTIMTPSREDLPGFLSIYSPLKVTDTANRESFVIEASFVTPFVNYVRRTRITANAAWNDKNMRCSAAWARPEKLSALMLLSSSAIDTKSLNAGKATIRSGSEISGVLATYWLTHREALTNIIIDANIPLTSAELGMLLKFCVLNGIELDIYAREIPSSGLVRAGAFTGGKVLYSIAGEIDIPVSTSHMRIEMPLTVELSSSGYPGRSMLAMYLDAGLIQSRAWIPLYPDMFE